MYHLNLENVESRNQENSGNGIMDSGKSVDQKNSGATILKPEKSWSILFPGRNRENPRISESLGANRNLELVGESWD